MEIPPGPEKRYVSQDQPPPADCQDNSVRVRVKKGISLGELRFVPVGRILCGGAGGQSARLIMPKENGTGKRIDHARHCLALVEKALESAQSAQKELMDMSHSDFDRMAIVATIDHLERALAELRCFGPEDSRRPFG